MNFINYLNEKSFWIKGALYGLFYSVFSVFIVHIISRVPFISQFIINFFKDNFNIAPRYVYLYDFFSFDGILVTLLSFFICIGSMLIGIDIQYSKNTSKTNKTFTVLFLVWLTVLHLLYLIRTEFFSGCDFFGGSCGYDGALSLAALAFTITFSVYSIIYSIAIYKKDKHSWMNKILISLGMLVYGGIFSIAGAGYGALIVGPILSIIFLFEVIYLLIGIIIKSYGLTTIYCLFKKNIIIFTILLLALFLFILIQLLPEKYEFKCKYLASNKYERSACYYKVAINNNDANLCLSDKVKGKWDKSDCAYRIAYNTKNPETCKVFLEKNMEGYYTYDICIKGTKK